MYYVGSLHARYSIEQSIVLGLLGLAVAVIFGIETTGPHISKEAGGSFRDPRNGKIYRYNRDCYYLLVRAQGPQRFSECISFTISRKQRILVEAIRR